MTMEGVVRLLTFHKVRHHRFVFYVVHMQSAITPELIAEPCEIETMHEVFCIESCYSQ